MRKLIRDKLPYVGEWSPEHKFGLVQNQREYDTLILKKLEEEFDELVHACTKRRGNPDEVVQEAGDLLQVLSHVLDRYASCNLAEALSAMERKREHNGGFDAGVIWENAPEDT